MLKSYNFPSVYEATNQELANVAENILDGLKINLDDTDYIVGNLALVEGYSPHKSINAAPTDAEYKLLSEASLLLTQPKGEEEIYLTTGFPFATYILYRDKAMEVLQGRHIINYDASTFGGPNTTKREVNVGRVEIYDSNPRGEPARKRKLFYRQPRIRHLRSRRFDKSRTDQPFSRQYPRYPSCRKFIG